MNNLPKMQDGLPDGVVVEIKVCVHASGAMSVHGPIDDKPWMLAALANAMDAVRNHGKPASALIVPGKDVSLV
jgi:hypothetical protein